jgi:hypothetical protein
VDVRIDECRDRDEAVAVDHLGAVGRGQRVADLGDVAVAQHDVADAVEIRARVEQARAADDDVGRVVRGRVERRGLEPRRHHAAPIGSGAGSAATGAGAPDPASSSYRTAILTTTPDSTCWVIRACGESITSDASSTPRFTGPGCMRSCPALRRRPSI